MFKSLIAVAAASAFSTPAFAGFYLGVDTKSTFTGSDYSATEFTGKVGYEGSLTSTSYFVEGGPVTTSPDGGDTSTEFFVAGGLGVPITDSIGAKVSLKYDSNDGGDNKYELKSGLKYKF